LLIRPTPELSAREPTVSLRALRRQCRQARARIASAGAKPARLARGVSYGGSEGDWHEKDCKTEGINRTNVRILWYAFPYQRWHEKIALPALLAPFALLLAVELAPLPGADAAKFRSNIAASCR